jgi:cyclic beta-1,2-glucan synthetase
MAGPFVVLWARSPLVARWVSQPPRVSTTPALSPPEAMILRATARRTWRFFETFIGLDDSVLPPDNFQEDPKPVVAHRTSPTNIGLSLLATVAARDLGWIGSLDTMDRLEATLVTMRRLERFRGHFYNWYDTVDLRPLEPRYVSTVDSGNLAGHLLVLGRACRTAVDRPLLDREAFTCTHDAVRLVQDAARDLAADQRSQTVTLADLRDSAEALAATPTSPRWV